MTWSVVARIAEEPKLISTVGRHPIRHVVATFLNIPESVIWLTLLRMSSYPFRFDRAIVYTPVDGLQ